VAVLPDTVMPQAPLPAPQPNNDHTMEEYVLPPPLPVGTAEACQIAEGRQLQEWARKARDSVSTPGGRYVAIHGHDQVAVARTLIAGLRWRIEEPQLPMFQVLAELNDTVPLARMGRDISCFAKQGSYVVCAL
jgi:hypothetical protein